MVSAGFESHEQSFKVHTEANWELVELSEGQGRRLALMMFWR